MLLHPFDKRRSDNRAVGKPRKLPDLLAAMDSKANAERLVGDPAELPEVVGKVRRELVALAGDS